MLAELQGPSKEPQLTPTVEFGQDVFAPALEQRCQQTALPRDYMGYLRANRPDRYTDFLSGAAFEVTFFQQAGIQTGILLFAGQTQN